MPNSITLEEINALIQASVGRIEGVDNRIDFLHDALNERLVLKDRWITDMFGEVDKRMEAAGKQAASEHKSLREATLYEQNALKEWMQSRFDAGQRRLDDYIEFRRLHGEQIVTSHMETHRVSEMNLEDFKDTVQQRLEVVAKTLEILREERGLFILRDSHEAQIDALEKLIDSLERAMGDRMDGAIKQLRDTHDARITTNLERLQKMEQNLHVMNARNQQSIIALGILLTLVEIIIRYYQRG